jgi:hypothetical protein
VQAEEQVWRRQPLVAAAEQAAPQVEAAEVEGGAPWRPAAEAARRAAWAARLRPEVSAEGVAAAFLCPAAEVSWVEASCFPYRQAG